MLTNFQKLTFLSGIIILVINLNLSAQSLSHPHILIKDSDKSALLEKIDQKTWAGTMYGKYVNRVKSKKDDHLLDQKALLQTIPAMPGKKDDHNKILTLGFESAMLYWLTDDEGYAQLAADILYHYTKKIAGITGNVNFHTGGSDAYLIDTRYAYPKLPVIYDFVYSFIDNANNKVFDLDQNKEVSFNMSKAQTTFKKLADNVFTRGSVNSNHPVLEAPGALFNCLAIEDDDTRKNYMDKFINGTSKQNGLAWMMDEIKNNGTWPEATGYSIGPHRIVLELMYIVELNEPSRNIIGKNKDVLKNAFFYENYRFPDGNNVMRFGDAHRNRLNTKDLMQRVLAIAEQKVYGTIAKEALVMLEALYSSSGYKPSVSTEGLEWNNHYHLFWTSDINTNNAMPIEYNTSVNIDYAGIAMQRNLNTSEDTKEYGLMGYTGGAHYVHSHLTGIDMEIYGLGAVLGTGGGDVGASARNGAEFRNYHRIYAGHNTVIVNGKSKGKGKGAWKSDNQLFQDKTVTIAAEPASTQDPESYNFSFSAQQLDDKVNNALQQRVFSIVRTGPKSGYYFDMFRSKSNGTNNYHDYIYHNVGDQANLYQTNGQALLLSSKTTRYAATPSTYNGKTINFPGWQYFESVKTSSRTTQAVKATIPMTKQGKRYMHMHMPGGQSREYTACKGPKTIEGQVGYTKEKTPIVTVRHFGEAYTKPFISVFEPSRNENGSVQSVENLMNGSKIVGAKVVSVVDNKTITDYIISNINANDTYNSSEYNISFTGRFGIVRTVEENGTTDVIIYIGEGSTLSYETVSLNAGPDKKGELVENGHKKKSEITVSLTAPANKSTFELGQQITLKANASSRGGSISKVNFRKNSSFLKQINSAPYTTNWTPTEAGTYKIDAVAFDQNGSKKVSASRTVTIVEPAVISIDLTSPTNNATYQLGEAIPLQAKASITSGSITKVNFRKNNTYLKQDATSPYSYSWTPTEPGTYKIDAVGFSDSSASKVSSSVTITVVEPVELTVDLISPSNNATYELGEAIPLQANTTITPGNITKVNFRKNNAYLKQDATSPYSYSWTPTEPGTYKIDAVAYGNDSTSKVSSSVNITVVEPVAITVDMALPSNNITFQLGETITLQANASITQGSINKINYRKDKSFLKQSTTTPFAVSWTPTEPGTHKIDAVAYGDDSSSAVSSSITVTIKPEVTVESFTAGQTPNYATNMLDGNTGNGSRWSAQVFPQSVVFDLGAKMEITGAKMWTYLQRAYQYKVEVSDLPSSGFVLAVDKTANTNSTQPLTTVFNASGRYVKLTITGAFNYGSNWASINEFEILTGEVLKNTIDEESLAHANGSLMIYPNPTTGEFIIQLDQMKAPDLAIYNLQGALVYKQNITEDIIRLAKGGKLRTGMYMVVVKDQNQNMFYKKLIIQ